MTAEAYRLPEHRRDIFDMRAEAVLLDLRHRVEEPGDWEDMVTPTLYPSVSVEAPVRHWAVEMARVRLQKEQEYIAEQRGKVYACSRGHALSSMEISEQRCGTCANIVKGRPLDCPKWSGCNGFRNHIGPCSNA